MENAEKRVVKEQDKNGLGLKEIILVAVLLAAGAVLKFFAGSVVNFGGMKPNFIIAMYCLAIMLIKPKFHEAAVIGIIAGITCQFFPGTPWINLASETVGGIAMSLLLHLPIKFGKVNLRPPVCTFLTSVISGLTYLAVLYLLFYAGADVKPVALSVFAGIILGTSIINSIIVTVLYAPLSLAFKKN